MPSGTTVGKKSGSGKGQCDVHLLHPLLTYHTSDGGETEGQRQENRYDFHSRLAKISLFTIHTGRPEKHSLKTKKTTTKKVVGGHGTAQQLDGADESEHADEPSPVGEEELANGVLPRKRRRMSRVFMDISPEY